MEPSGSLVHRRPPTAPPPPSSVASCSAFSLSSSSSSADMEDLPFSLEDLPPEIRNKIDDIIDKNEDFESQLEAIDELLFADRLFAKFEGGTKYDIGSESGIGSDSDSGNGITSSSTDPLRNSPSSAPSSTFFRPPGEDAVIDPRTFGPLLLRSTSFQPEHDVDYLISRLIVPAPPSSSPSPSKSSVQHEAAQRNITPRFQSPMVGYQHRPQSKPTVTNGDGVSSTPLGLGAVLGKASRDTKDEPVRIARTTGDAHLESLQDSRSTPSPDTSGQDRNFSVSRTLATKWEGRTNSGPAASRILKNNRHSVNVAAELGSLQSNNTRPKTVTLSRSSSRTELYAWGDVPGLPTPSQSVVRASKPMIISEKPVFAIDSDAKRSSQPSLETSRKSKMFLRKDETESEESVGGGRSISGQWRNSEGLSGSTVDLRRNKWNSVSEFVPKGNAEVTEERGGVSDDEGSDVENVKKGVSPIEDNFSSLVRLREKNGKPSQMVRINPRTLKAQSMLSLYDPSSDAKEKAKVKKSNKKETGGASDSRKRLSTFLQRKLKFHKKSSEGTTARQSYEGTDLINGGVISKADSSETELHRSDYLGPNILPVPVRSSIPSPSLYSSLENKSNGNNARTRSRSVGPGHISEIFRIDSRDLNVDDDRPRLTFDTFRGQIEPIRWRDEKTNTSGTNGWNDASMTTSEPSFVSSEQSSVSSLAVNMSPSNGNNPIHLSTDNSLHRPNVHLNSRIERFDEKQATNNNFVKGVPTATLPVIKPAMLPASKPLRPQNNVAGRFTASGASASPQATLVMKGVSSRTLPNGLSEDSVNQCSSVPTSSEPHSGISNTNYHPKDVHSSVRQTGNSTKTTVSNAVFSTSNSPSISERAKNNGNEHRSYSEEQKVLQTSYDDAQSACDRAILDTRLTLSSLLADRERILSASNKSTPGAVYRARKELLASNCRQLVTDVKLMVAGATRSKRDLVDALTAAMHTFARVFEACRLTVEVLPIADGRRGSRRMTLLDEVLKVGDVFLDTLASGCVAAGRGQNDPAMELLMYHTTEMAISLGRLLNTIKSLDG